MRADTAKGLGHNLINGFFIIEFTMQRKNNRSSFILKVSRDFNEDNLFHLEEILNKEFTNEQYNEYCNSYNRYYFSENSHWIPSIIYYEIKKDEDANIYIFETSTSANTGERQDFSYLRCYEKDGKYWGFQEWDTDRDDYHKRVENRKKYNTIYENTESLLILKGYKLELDFKK